jgi:hypothetical protein
MSGAELVGLASSTLQIADLGWKLSYKLYVFSKNVHESGKTIELISQDISATGVILKQLGDEVGKDEKAKPNARLCSQGLIDVASKLVPECKELFSEIDLSIAGKDGNKSHPWLRAEAQMVVSGATCRAAADEFGTA